MDELNAGSIDELTKMAGIYRKSRGRHVKARVQKTRAGRKDLPAVIPPRSVFRLIRSDAKTPAWKADVGRVFRIGYYSRQDGLDEIRLVNEQGEYIDTASRDLLERYFEPIRITDESDYYGDHKRRLGPVRPRGRR